MTELSTNPQIDHDDTTTPADTPLEKANHLADDMAAKAGKIQSHNESTINSGGGVSPGGGGIFSK
jgi:hypothetical protein